VGALFERKDMKVHLYALSTCPYCRKAKQFLQEHKINFTFTDVDLAVGEERNRAVEKVLQLTGGRDFPVLVVDDEQVCVGYNPDRYREMLAV
jgi:glutaredoxin-like protein NrdH